MMAISTEDLRKLLDEATPGPWPSEPTGDGKRIIIGDGLVDGPGGYEVAEVYSDDCDRDEANANAALIRMSRDLAAELIAARAKIEAAEKLYAALDSIIDGRMWSMSLEKFGASKDALAAWESLK